jgi:hypothetical protein
MEVGAWKGFVRALTASRVEERLKGWWLAPFEPDTAWVRVGEEGRK